MQGELELLSDAVLQSTLSKADTLGTKATVRFREVSALERVPLQRYKCNSAGSGPNLLSGLESVRLERVDCILHIIIEEVVTKSDPHDFVGKHNLGKVFQAMPVSSQWSADITYSHVL